VLANLISFFLLAADEGSAQDLLQKAYSKLGLPMSATDDQVRARFKELAIKMYD